jgi:hypothetical protein
VRPPDFADLTSFLVAWKKRAEEATGLTLDVYLDVKCYKQGELFLEATWPPR